MTPDTRPITLTRRQILQLPEPIVIEKLVRPQPGKDYVWVGWIFDTTGPKTKVGKAEWVIPGSLFGDAPLDIRCPFGPIGQRFWVREAWLYGESLSILYAADHNKRGIWQPARTMPREYSRITLTLTSIAVVNRDGWRWRGVFEVTP